MDQDNVQSCQGDDRGAITALELVLATGILSPQDTPVRVQTLVQLDYRVRHHPQTIAEANRYHQQGGTVDEPRLLQVRAYFLQGDFPARRKPSARFLRPTTRPARSPTSICCSD